jgi:homoaconitase/3-isopropylmalate dehydratase large subunit
MSMIRDYAKNSIITKPFHLGIYTTLLTAFTVLLWKSEYVVIGIKGKSKHHLCAKDVTFTVSGQRIKSTDPNSSHLSFISEVIIKLRSSKTDQECAGTTF